MEPDAEHGGPEAGRWVVGDDDSGSEFSGMPLPAKQQAVQKEDTDEESEYKVDCYYADDDAFKVAAGSTCKAAASEPCADALESSPASAAPTPRVGGLVASAAAAVPAPHACGLAASTPAMSPIVVPTESGGKPPGPPCRWGAEAVAPLSSDDEAVIPDDEGGSGVGSLPTNTGFGAARNDDDAASVSQVNGVADPPLVQCSPPTASHSRNMLGRQLAACEGRVLRLKHALVNGPNHTQTHMLPNACR